MHYIKSIALLPLLNSLLTTASAGAAHNNQLVDKRSIDDTAAHPSITNPPVKRQDAAPTITVDDPKNIETATDGLTIPTGNHVNLVKNPDGSVDITLGPDLLPQLKNAADLAAVDSTLHQANFGVQARFIGLLTAGAVAAAAQYAALLSTIGVAIYGIVHELNKDPPSRLKVSPDTVNQINAISASPAGGIVFSTSGVPQTTSVAAPSVTITSAVTVATNSAGGLDFEIVDKPSSDFLKDEGTKNTDCSTTTPARVKRQDQPWCGKSHAEHAIAALGGPLMALIAMPPDIVGPANAALQATIDGLVGYGKTLYGGLSEEDLKAIATFFVWYYSRPSVDDTKFTVPASDISSTGDGPEGCPKDAGTPACEDDDCKGDPKGDRKCIVPGDKLNCPCAITVEVIPNTSGDLDWLKAQQEIFDGMVKGGGSTPSNNSFEKGECSMHITEHETACLDVKNNLSAEIVVWDAKHNEIGRTQKTSDGKWPGINDGASLRLDTKAGTLVVTGEHQNDYIQLTLEGGAGFSWTSRTTKEEGKPYYCIRQEPNWDPREGSVCFAPGEIEQEIKDATAQVDCFWQC